MRALSIPRSPVRLDRKIIPDVLIEMLQDPDPAKAGRVMQAMLQMVIDIARLRQAYEAR